MQLKYANYAAYNTTVAKRGKDKVWWCWHMWEEVWGHQHLMYKNISSEKENV